VSTVETVRALPGWNLLSPAGRHYVEQVLCAPAHRKVGANALVSVCGGYAASKFPYLVEYESAGCEKPYVLLSVLDDQVLELRAQPTALLVTAHDKLGRRLPRHYTPDYLEVRHDRFWLVEAKTEDDLTLLAANSPDWTRGDQGWRYLPAEAAAANLGLGFKIFCPQEHPRAFLVNAQYFASVSSDDLMAASRGLLARTRRALVKRPLPLSNLCGLLPGLTGGVVFQAIVAGALFGDLNSQHFDADFLVYGTADAFRRAGRLRPRIACRERGPLEARLLSASEKEIAAAMEKSKKYEARRQEKVEMNSTDHRFKLRIVAAEREGAPKLAAFVPNFKGRGSKARRITDVSTRDLVRLAEKYLSEGGLPIHSRMYAHYVAELTGSGGYIVSRETHRTCLSRHLAPERAAFLAGGKRAFHASKPRTGGAEANARLQIAGIRCHLDGVLADLKSRKTDEHPSLRLIIYPMVDDVSGRVLGRGIKIGKGDRQSALMAIRDTYLRCGCLPGTVFTDRGSEFNNQAFEQALGFFGCSYEVRPSGAARMGGMGEMFNAQLSRFLQGFEGGMFFDKAGRSADGSKKSARTAALSVESIISQLDEWIFEVWNKTPIGGNELTPDEIWSSSIQIFPDAVQTVSDSPLARYFTSVPLGARIKDPVHGLRYGSRAFSAANLPLLLASGGAPDSPRIDCENPSIIHLLTNQGPLELHSLDYQRCLGLSQAQLVLEMHRFQTNRARADVNQQSRNLKEAQQRRDWKATARSVDQPEIKDSSGEMSTAFGNGCKVYDFSSFKESPPALEAIKSRVQGERK